MKRALAFVLLTACGQPPDLPPLAATAQGQPPALIPLDGLLTEASGGPTEASITDLSARADALRARADRLRRIPRVAPTLRAR